MSINHSPARRRNTDAFVIIALLLMLGGALLLLAQFRGGTTNQAATVVTPTACPTPDLSTEVLIPDLSTTVPTEVGHIDPTPLPQPIATEARIVELCNQLATDEARRAHPYPEPEQAPYPAPAPSPAWDSQSPCRESDMSERGLGRLQPVHQAPAADVIVRGTVTNISEPRWDTPDGTRPPDPCGGQSNSYIYRIVTVNVVTYLKGTQSTQDVLVDAWGGTIGQDVYEISAAFDQYSVGEEVVLFLSGGHSNTLDGQPLFRSFEHYTLVNERAKNFFQEISEDELLEQIKAAQ